MLEVKTNHSIITFYCDRLRNKIPLEEEEMMHEFEDHSSWLIYNHIFGSLLDSVLQKYRSSFVKRYIVITEFLYDYSTIETTVMEYLENGSIEDWSLALELILSCNEKK